MLFAQKDRKELEQRKKKLQQEMANLNQMLNETTSNKEISLTQLITLNKKISVREEIISTINREVDLIQSQISKGNDSIDVMQTRLDELKKEYARMIYDAYKNENAYSKLMFIFSSKDFEQAVMRTRYLQEYEEYRHKQAIIIDSTKKDLNVKVQQLQKRKEEKKELLQSQEDEKGKLADEKTDQQKLFTDLQGKEKKLRQQLDEKRKAAQKLDEAIHKLIEEEIKKSSPKANPKNPKSKEISLTPEAQALSKTFESNKGKLPWPVVEGVIYKQFGTYSPMPGITMSNNGIDIATTKGAVVRAVFEGVVTAVVEVPSSGKVVMIRHGEFLTVYANLKDVFVKAGDKVEIKKNIGTILYDEDDGKTDLQFQIWKGQDKINPEEWLYNK
ncbi:MAG TPA: peptidoglycan DD-metalloendopeptidase family protein [Bacteroidia bacterium]|jgi:septal ring factor EnvC (AmiA/AmiB activator)|nr:peptidoglycan DD-metalloendopeptidase family protein [Bacteroidia bacterium]